MSKTVQLGEDLKLTERPVFDDKLEVSYTLYCKETDAFGNDFFQVVSNNREVINLLGKYLMRNYNG